MQVTEQEKKGLKRQFKIVVDAKQIDAQTEAELKAAGERVKIPGFRPGFIPMKILQQRYGKSVQADVLKQVINRATGDVLKERKLRPALTPQVDIDKSYTEGKDLSFTMSVELFPEVPEVAFDKITIDRHVVDVSEKDIDDAVNRVADRAPKLARAKEGSKAKKGNVVAIDFKGMIDGKAFDGGSAQNFKLELGSGQFIDNFEEQLEGAKEGDDRIVKVTFPKDYGSQDLAGKEASFAVTVREIFEKEAAKIDDQFAKDHGFADMRALREAARNQLMREYDQFIRNQLKKQLFDVLEEQSNFELPPGMVDLEFSTIWERLQQAKKEGDESILSKSDEELKEEYMAIAKRRVKLGILLAELGHRHKVQVTREELSRAVMQQASMFPGQEKKVMEFYQNNPDRIEDLRGPILEEKAVDYILGKVSFNDKKISAQELLEMDSEGGSPAGKKAAKSAEKPQAKAAAKKK